ncbi:MAG: hypothetical protein HW414_1739, partial [Dehalococcoidia bacterium]|nr:hypothetical protein [Dehalococcoidia bacterium]
MRNAFLLLVALALLLAFIPFAPSFATPANAQIISISPTTGAVGTLVTLTGPGFGNALPFSITFDDIFVAEGKTTDIGLVSASFSVPSGVKLGRHTVTFTSGAFTAFAFFEVAKSAITLSVSDGAVGTGVTVNGTGFPSSTNVDILYDGDLIATRTTAISGVF